MKVEDIDQTEARIMARLARLEERIDRLERKLDRLLFFVALAVLPVLWAVLKYVFKF